MKLFQPSLLPSSDSTSSIIFLTFVSSSWKGCAIVSLIEEEGYSAGFSSITGVFTSSFLASFFKGAVGSGLIPAFFSFSRRSFSFLASSSFFFANASASCALRSFSFSSSSAFLIFFSSWIPISSSANFRSFSCSSVSRSNSCSSFSLFLFSMRTDFLGMAQSDNSHFLRRMLSTYRIQCSDFGLRYLRTFSSYSLSLNSLG